MATVHLIHGYLCSGKTRFAKELEKRTGAIRLSLDEWVIAVSGENEHLDDQIYERVLGLVTDLWPRIAERGVDVVLDFGFWRRAERDAARAQAARVGAAAKLYLVHCPDDVARERCRRRNERLQQGQYRIDDNAFEMLRSKFEPLDPDEPYQVLNTS
jgi:predicted kinase